MPDLHPVERIYDTPISEEVARIDVTAITTLCSIPIAFDNTSTLNADDLQRLARIQLLERELHTPPTRHRRRIHHPLQLRLKLGVKLGGIAKNLALVPYQRSSPGSQRARSKILGTPFWTQIDCVPLDSNLSADLGPIK
jgi:hypothetical protein